jgi:septal ring factor EnvC (AmiA/AmiB activator)
MEFEKKSKEMEYLQSNYEQAQRENSSLYTKNKNGEVEIGEMRAKLREYEKKNKDLNRMNNGLTNDKDRVTREKKEAEHEKSITKAGVNALTREIEYLRKQTDNEKTNILNLIRDRDMMSKYIRKAEEENAKNKDELTKKQNEIA